MGQLGWFNIKKKLEKLQLQAPTIITAVLIYCKTEHFTVKRNWNDFQIGTEEN